jgi:phage baseplate assembly protein W
MTRPKAIFYGFNPPFLGGAEKILSRQEDERLIKNDILQLLLTNPGDRVMRPSFGIGLRSMVFDPGSEDDTESMKERISTGIINNDSRVLVRDVIIKNDLDRNAISVRVIVSLKINPKVDISIETLLRGR